MYLRQFMHFGRKPLLMHPPNSNSTPMRKEKKPEKVRTTIDVDRKLWSFVKSEATEKGEKTSQVIERILKKEKERSRREEE